MSSHPLIRLLSQLLYMKTKNLGDVGIVVALNTMVAASLVYAEGVVIITIVIGNQVLTCLLSPFLGKRRIVMKFKRLLIIPVLFMTLLAVSVFATSQAYAATTSGKVLTSAKAPHCGSEIYSQNDYPDFLIQLWEDTCSSEFGAQLIAHVSGTFDLYLTGDGNTLEHQYGYLDPNQKLYTHFYSGYSSYNASGVYDG